MLRAFMAVYPWDLADEGVERVLDRLLGEVGVTGLSLWVGSPPVVQLRVRDVEPRVFRTAGGIFFLPAEGAYAGTRCQPVVSGWLKGSNPLPRIAEACAARGLELRAIVSAASTALTPERYAEMTCRNAFGSRSQRNLCLANPDVQTYLGRLARDLSSNYGLAGLTLVDFGIAWADAFAPEFRDVLRPRGAARSLLATCFCESCHQKATAAGVDVPSARRSVRAALQRSLETGLPAPQIESMATDHPPLAAYHRWRSDELCTLLRHVVESCRCPLLLDRPSPSTGCPQHESFDWSVPGVVITRVDHRDQLGAALLPAAQGNELRVTPSLVFGHDGAELVSMLSHATELGFKGVTFDHYGLLPDAVLTSIKQAIRFARRTASQ